jgi:hypothetical protein
MLFYPGYNRKADFDAWRKGKQKINCPVCERKCKVIDAKTGLERDCVACKGTGVIFRPKQYETA